MNLQALQKALTEPFGTKRAKPKDSDNWLPRKAYAEAWSVSTKTIGRRTDYLRRVGAAVGTNKMTRYNPNVAPTGEIKRT